MKLNLPESITADSCIGITIGSFDGVHKGHQFILDRFQKSCEDRELTPIVISFSPHPSVFIQNKENFMLDSSHKKREFLKKTCNVHLLEIEFNELIKNMTGIEFFRSLCSLLPNIKFFYAGHDFALGANKEFNFEKAKSSLMGIELFQEEKLELKENLISSTEIRQHLKEGNIEKSNYLLGHIFKLTGKVAHGNKLGRSLGFPTANLSFDRTQLLPDNGVYFCRCQYSDRVYRSIVNIGTRPTITDDLTRVVEVNLFDFNESIYDEEISIEFFSKIRDEIKFSSKNELIEQIKIDKQKCESLIYYGEMGLIGEKISHSKSEEIYRKLIGNSYISYSLIDCKTISRKQLLCHLNKIPYLSITSPHKKRVFDLIDEFPNNIYELASVNAIKRVGDKIIGINTDALALESILGNIELDHSKILILGDGAMSTLLTKILDRMELSFKVFSRKKNNLDKLYQVKDENCFIINACSRSFTPVLNDSIRGSFWDLNYSQAYENSFKKNKKLKYENGLELLTLQATFSLSFWNLKGH
jgi:riboflavin kinase/FMN adenylyltransferase